jgi:hypothetical protein
VFSQSRFLLLALCIGLLGTCACQNNPKMEPATNRLPTAGKPAFGSFNLHKRHGLGDWQGQKAPSQNEWLDSIQQNQPPHQKSTFR